MRVGRLSLRRAPAWADELDLIGPRARTGPLAWLLLLAGLFAVGAVAPMVSEAEAGLQAAQEEVKRLERATHQHALRSQPSARAQRGDAGALTAAQQRGATRLAQTLSYPWLDVLARTESAAQAQEVALLSFSADLAGLGSGAVSTAGRNKVDAKALGNGVDVRLGAAVASDDQALRWADAHGPGAQLLGRARLASSSSSPTAMGDAALAWRADAVWRGGLP